MKILVCSAWEPELTHFRGLARGVPTAELVAEPVGVGVVDAAVGATRCIERHRPSHVVLLGTCGAAPTGDRRASLLDVVVGTRARLVDAAVTEGRAELPSAMAAEAPLDADLAAAMQRAGAKSVHIANTVGITVDDALADRLAAYGEVEHLEAYGVARASLLLGVPCAIVLGVANVVGMEGRAQWLVNQRVASANAAEVAWRAIAAMRGA